MLVRLLYASRSADPIDEALVAAILERSRKHNLEHGITGILCTYSQEGLFLQLLEGGRAAVNRLYGAILRDTRHKDVMLLDYAEITERKFASWRMGSVNLNRVNLGSILRFSETSKLDPFTMSGKAALTLIEELASTAAVIGHEVSREG
jgi:hypothetical protein